MKKSLMITKTMSFVLAVFASTMLFSSCVEGSGDSDDIVFWDIAGVGVDIRIVDEDGNNLLNPTVEGNWIGEGFGVAYKDELYTPTWKYVGEENGSRKYFAKFYGLECLPVREWKDKGGWTKVPNEYYLSFGEFQGDQNQDVEFDFLVFERNCVDHIEMKHRIVWKNNEPHTSTEVTFNGKRVEGRTIEIVLPKRDW